MTKITPIHFSCECPYHMRNNGVGNGFVMGGLVEFPFSFDACEDCFTKQFEYHCEIEHSIALTKISEVDWLKACWKARYKLATFGHGLPPEYFVREFQIDKGNEL